MNAYKRFASVLLVVVMAFAMAATAFAAENNGEITVSNPVTGQTYTAYKIFDVTYNTGKTSYAYSIDGDSEWFDIVDNYNGITLTKAASGNQYVVETTGTFSAAEFANLLKANAADKTGTVLTANEFGGVTASNLPLGYYFVSSTSGALCNLTTTKPTASIRDKNDVPFEKVDDQSTVQVGDTVEYTITGKVPDTTGFQTYQYIISDTMSAGLTYLGHPHITVGGMDLSMMNYVLDDRDDGFTLTIKVDQLQNLVGREIKVEYNAVVNDNAVSQISKNSATLTYSNDPTDSTSTTTTPADEETVYSAKIVIDKYEAGNATKKLSGATFVLKNAEGKYYKYTPKAENGYPAVVAWVDSIDDATAVTTNTSGAAAFNGLKDGTYQLVETAAPVGYNMLKTPVDVVIDGSQATEADVTSLTATAQVENNTGTTLPETGGIGTTIFYLLGGILVAGAGVMLVTKKRMGRAE